MHIAIIPTVIYDPYFVSENRRKINIFASLPILLPAEKMRIIFKYLLSGGKIIQLKKCI